MRIHKEGYTTIIIAIAFLTIINVISFKLIPFLLIHVFILLISLVFFYLILHFFRNPERKVLVSNKDIMAPSDGKLVVNEEVFENEFLKEDCGIR